MIETMNIPGYTHGTRSVAPFPIQLADFEPALRLEPEHARE